MSRVLLSGVLGLITLIGLAHAAHAASPGSQSITLTPSSTEITISPGDSVDRNFKIINNGKDDFRAHASVEPYRVVGENYDAKFTQLPGTVNSQSWVAIDNPDNTVVAGKEATVKYSVTVPANAAPGGYYLVLFAQTNPVNEPKGGVVPHNRVGNILYITVKGPVKTSGALNGADLDGFLIKKTVPLGVKVSNDGGVHFLSTTSIHVKNMLGKQIFSASLERYILPQTERLVTTDWKITAPIGIYTVSRSATVAGKTQNVPDKRIVVVKPWFFTLMVLLVVLIVFYILTRRAIRSKKSRHDNVR